jgi:hypothetical protein
VHHLKTLRAALFLLMLASSLPMAASAQAQPLPGGDWSPAAGAAGDNTLVGFIDQPASGAPIAAGASFTVSGWVVDTSADGWAGVDGVQVVLGSNVLAQAAVALPRPDVGNALGNPFFAASGFNAVVGTALPGGTQTLTVVAHTPGKGSWSKQVTVNVGGGAGGGVSPGTAANSGLVLKIVSPSPDDLIVANNNGTISGIAYDTRTRADLGVGVDRVQAYLDGPRGTTGSQALGDATFNGNQWSISWQPTRYNHVSHHILWVYARSSVTGEEALVQQEINIGH